MRIRSFISLVLVACCTSLFAQIAPDTYWVQFTDKGNTPYSLSQPDQFLTQRAIDRRQVQGISLDASDLPVDPAYIAGVLATGEVDLINRSKWFNAITIRTVDANAITVIQQLPYVLNVRERLTLTHGDSETELSAPLGSGARGGDPGDYGASYLQISMLNGQVLHTLEAKGQGMLIGVLDSGFEDADSLAAFDDLRTREGILLTRDMVNHDGDVYDDHWHGRSVLSCMTGILPGYLQGTAPAADYVLLRTEAVADEYVVEEDNWVAGAELCDSLGCDVLSTSLGYTEFDSTFTADHVYADMNGTTTRISIAAGMASQKGMIPVCSAGNSGQAPWHYIGAPADAIDILAVGAVGDQEQHAPFSSFGPSADGRVKPDVCTLGWGAIGLRIDGDSIAPLNGTSFSAPILAGLVACLWQLHPDRTGHDIMNAIRRSADHWNNPNDSLGYGIPDFLAAHGYLELTEGINEASATGMEVYPVPFESELRITMNGAANGNMRVTLSDVQGRTVWSGSSAVNSSGSVVLLPGPLAAGMYLLRAEMDGLVRTVRVVRR